MAATGNVLGTGISGLLAFQRTLNVVSHNIANVNTDGYNRQRVDYATRTPLGTSVGFIGNGVEVTGIRRMYDEFLNDQVLQRTSLDKQLGTYHQLASEVDNLLADPSAGLASATQGFFDAVQGVANDPTSIPARQVLIAQAEALVDRFHSMDRNLSAQREAVNEQMRITTSEISSMAKSIAKLNHDIILAQGTAGGQPPNDLLDRRDYLIEQLAERVEVKTVPQGDGALNVFIGNGQSLVLGSQAYDLDVAASPFDVSEYEVVYSGTGNTVTITNALTGGTLSGGVDFRGDILDEVQNNLGRIALGISNLINDQHKLGMDLTNSLGGNFFNDLLVEGPKAVANVNNTGTGVVDMSISDMTAVTTDEYLLEYDGASYTLTNLTDLTQASAPTLAALTPAPNGFDGFTLSLASGAVAAGDQFIVRPTRYGARDIDTVINDPEKIAAAAPIRTNATIGNTGNGSISAGKVLDVTNPAFAVAGQLTPPLMIQFTSPLSYDVYDNTLPGAPVLLEAGIAYNPAVENDVFPTPGALDFGYQATLSGAMAAGDSFTVEYNTDGFGDNRNALSLSQEQTQPLLAAGTTTLDDSYGRMVAEVGVKTRQAEINSNVQRTLLDQTLERRESITGVNLDEEAANLVRFQQAYQAAAQVIAVAGTMFDTLLGAVRR